MFRSHFSVGLALLLIATAPAVGQGRPKAGEVLLESSSAKAAGVGTVDFDLGTRYVPQNRNEPGSRVIGVGFARFKSTGKSDAPPLFLLPGGPGGSFRKA